MTETSSTQIPQNQLDRALTERLDAIVMPIVQTQGGEVVDVEWKPEGPGWVLRVYVEKLGAQAKGLSTKEAGVTLELCANVARELSPALDALEDSFPHAYSLEVSSPGVERPLKKRDDFARFVGEKAKIWLTKAAHPRGVETNTSHGQRVVEGRLEAFEASPEPSERGGVIVVRDASRTFDIPFDDVDRARLVFELVSGTKSGAKSGSNGSRGTKNKPGKSPKRPETKSDPSPRTKTGEQQ